MKIEERPLHVRTPLIKSESLARLLPGSEVLMKMESEQVTGSFKMRGIANRCQMALKRGSHRLVGASGGNAGLALARSAKLLNVPCSVYVPKTTSPLLIDKMRADGAEVVIHGDIFKIASARAKEEAKQPGVAFVHAYDQPDTWEGNSSLIHELVTQMTTKPSVIVISVGGGGLLSGVLLGLRRVGWSDVPVVAMETQGAHCFNLSVKAKKLMILENITSIATTLGASSVPPELMEILPEFNVISEVITDSQAVSSCLQFADEENTIVEPSCGAALAAIYCDVLSRLEREGRLRLGSNGPVVMVVCGGTGASLEMLHNWATSFGIEVPSADKKKSAVGSMWTQTPLQEGRQLMKSNL